MSSLDIVTRKVEELNKQADEIEQQGIDILRGSTISPSTRAGSLVWSNFGLENKTLRQEAIQKYQGWYSVARYLIKEYVPEKEDEFVEHYETKAMYKHGVFDYLHLRNGTEDKDINRVIARFIDALETQRSIVLSIPAVAEIKELNLRKIISADIARTEIEQAEVLFANGFERAAGSIGGVALELQLKTLCNIYGINYAPRDTIEPLATALYKAGKLDITEFKKIQYLASIRNKCSHPNPVSLTEIKDLIDDVKKLI